VPLLLDKHKNAHFTEKSPPIPKDQENNSIICAAVAEWLLAHRKQHTSQTRNVSPLGSLYRMYEYTVVANNTGLRTEIEFFFNHPDWAVSAIPDPKDEDPKRYAILAVAVLPYFMVAEFNRLIEKGLPRGSPPILLDEDPDALRLKSVIFEEVPQLTSRVSKLEKKLVIPEPDGSDPDEEILSSEFLRMNIKAAQPHVLFV